MSSEITQNNGTGPSSFPETTLSQKALRCLFLSFFIVVGFVGNCLVIATITNSRRLRSSALNLLIISFASVNVVDCLMNMPLILGATFTEKWDYGDFICQFNSCIMQLCCIATYLHILLMLFDRAIAVHDPAHYKEKLTRLRINVLILVIWGLALVFSLPILTGSIESKVYDKSYMCSISDGVTILYILIMNICCFMAPTILIIICFILIIKWSIQEKMKAKRMLQNHTYTDTLIHEPIIWKQVRGSIYVGILFVLWCVLEGPYLLIRYTELYTNSSELRGSATAIFSYPWEVDLAFAWMNLSYVIFLPFVTFYSRKEIWQKFKDLLLCKKSNLIVDSSPRERHKKKDELDEKEKQRIDRLFDKVINTPNNTINPNASFNAPVLFATHRGLRLQNTTDDVSEIETEEDEYLKTSHDSYFFADITTKSNLSKTVRGKNCDVRGSKGQVRSENDTSDYGSHTEIDPFSITASSITHKRSQSLGDNKRVSRSRSNSQGDDCPQLTQSLGTEVLRKVKEEAFQESVPKSKSDETVNSLTDTTKRRRHKSKNSTTSTKVEHLAQVHQDDCHRLSPRHDTEERISNDSGRGTYEKHNSKSRTSRPKIEITVNVGGDIGDIEKGSEEKSGTDNAMASPVSPSKKAKKKRKKKPQNIEMGSVHNDGETKLEDKSVINSKPPPRLKPLDHQNVPPKSERGSPRFPEKIGAKVIGNGVGNHSKSDTSGHDVKTTSNVKTGDSGNNNNNQKRPVSSVKRESKEPLIEQTDLESIIKSNGEVRPKRKKARSDSTQELLTTSNSPRD